MSTQKSIGSSSGIAAESHTDYLAQEYAKCQALFKAQPTLIQRFLEAQSRKLADAVSDNSPQVRFTLPDRVVVKEEGQDPPVPKDMREQMAGGLVDRLTRSNMGVALRQRLDELEASANKAVAASAGLIRYAVAMHMVHGMLPAGRTVTYRAEEDEEIPSLPVVDELEPESAITATTCQFGWR